MLIVAQQNQTLHERVRTVWLKNLMRLMHLTKFALLVHLVQWTWLDIGMRGADIDARRTQCARKGNVVSNKIECRLHHCRAAQNAPMAQSFGR